MTNREETIVLFDDIVEAQKDHNCFYSGIKIREGDLFRLEMIKIGEETYIYRSSLIANTIIKELFEQVSDTFEQVSDTEDYTPDDYYDMINTYIDDNDLLEEIELAEMHGINRYQLIYDRIREPESKE